MNKPLLKFGIHYDDKARIHQITLSGKLFYSVRINSASLQLVKPHGAILKH